MGCFDDYDKRKLQPFTAAWWRERDSAANDAPTDFGLSDVDDEKFGYDGLPVTLEPEDEEWMNAPLGPYPKYQRPKLDKNLAQVCWFLGLDFDVTDLGVIAAAAERLASDRDRWRKAYNLALDIITSLQEPEIDD
jgi:hypothetical protein